MKIIEVPILNEDGSLQFTQVISAEEAQTLLQFALNFLAASGLSMQILIAKNKQEEENPPVEFND